MITSAANITVKLLTNKLPDLKNPTFNRDPAFIGDPASIRTLASILLHLVVSCSNVRGLRSFYSSRQFSVFILTCLAKKTRNICVSTKCLVGVASYDVTSVWLLLCTVLPEDRGFYLGPGI